MKFTRLALGLALAGLSFGAHATNGMLMEGYGPIATAMGGAAMAHDNGNAAMANNPAALGLMAEGARLDVALGFIGPDVKSDVHGKSEADAFYMPAFGYVKKTGRLAYGIGVYAQGGMGTEFPDDAGNMSQVGVGRVIFPLAYEVTEKLIVGGSVDVVWAGMDVKFSNFGIDFKDDSDYTGEAKGYSLAAKLGFVYRLNERLNVGGVYQSAGNLGDLEDGGWKVKGFDMPAVLGLGLAWQASDRLMLAADVKKVFWSDSMNTVTFFYPGGGSAPFMQNWDDQIVTSVGVAYKATDALTLRAGYNHAANPIPKQNLSHLWPAIVEHHYTAGFGYAFGKASELSASLTYAPTAKATSPDMYGPFDGSAAPVTMKHSQINWQIMYSWKF